MSYVTVNTVRKNGITKTLPNQREVRLHSSGVEVVMVKGALYPITRISPTEVTVHLDKGHVEAVSPSKIAFEAAKAEAAKVAKPRSEASKRGKAKVKAEVDHGKVVAKVIQLLTGSKDEAVVASILKAIAKQ